MFTRKSIAATPSQLHPLDKNVVEFMKDKKIVDLTAQLWEQGKQGIIDLQRPFCFGREQTLTQLCTYLNMDFDPCNVLVLGQSGVGKTVLIKELARTLLTDKGHIFFRCRVFLMSTKCHHLDTLTFLAEKVGKKAILVFDECHKVFSKPHISLAKMKKFEFDLSQSADAWKPLLAENQLSIVGLSDQMETFTAEDPARRRRFTEIHLKELGVEATIKVIHDQGFIGKICTKYSRNISFTKESLEAAVFLSMAYFPRDTLPAKVYKILDPAVNWYLAENRDATKITEQTIVNYLEEVGIQGFRLPREDVHERLTEMRDLATSDIPPDTPLTKYTFNLSSQARRGKFAPAWGREELVDTLSAILAAPESNNIVLTGPPGCGKSRIAEGLALAIHDGTLPHLRGREVLLLNWELAQSHLSDFIESARKYQGRFILVIDEAHRLGGPNETQKLPDPSSLLSNPSSLLSNPMGVFSQTMSAGSNFSDSFQSMGFRNDALEALKEPLARGEIPTLALTTDSEAKHILRDDALKRRFQQIRVPLFTAQETVEIVERESSVIEHKFNNKVSIDRMALEAIYYLSEIYYSDGYQPASSFKLLYPIFSMACRRKDKKVMVNETDVIEAVARIHNKKPSDVAKTLHEERISDHPSSRLIPPGEPLRRYTEDFTKEARKKDSLFLNMKGHEKPFEDLKIALTRATCNNVVLVGPAGTGKTTLVMRLASKMVSNPDELPHALQNIPLLSLNLRKLKENPHGFSEFLESAKRYAGQYILFVDEIHLLMGSSSPNPLGIPLLSKEFEELKPLLADGNLTLIGATTPGDLKNILPTDPQQTDKTITRRFKFISLNSPTDDEAINMLQYSSDSLRQEMSKRLCREVKYEATTLAAAVEMAHPKEGLPASAISLLESAAVRKGLHTPGDSEIVVTPDDLVEEEESSYFTQQQPLFGDMKQPSMRDAFNFVRQANRAANQANNAKKPDNQKSGGFFSAIGSLFSSAGKAFFWPFRKIKIIFVRKPAQ